MATKPIRGLIMYQGPSQLKPDTEVVLIVTFQSANRKTGNLLQTWIIESKTNPVKANHGSATCGNCPMQSLCYVNSGQAPNSVFKGFLKGIYPVYDATRHNHLFLGRLLRMGSDGDPLAIPSQTWEVLRGLTIKSVGYTHQWREPSDHWPRKLMASVETLGDKAYANALGYRTFRVVKDYDEKQWDEIICLADSKGKNCANCMLCSGNHCNVVIKVHGSKSKKFNKVK